MKNENEDLTKECWLDYLLSNLNDNQSVYNAQQILNKNIFCISFYVLPWRRIEYTLNDWLIEIQLEQTKEISFRDFIDE